MEPIKLPSNRKFGFFFTLVFLIFSIYFYIKEAEILFYIFFLSSICFLAFTLFATNSLRPLNKLWMSFGLVLGMIVSPIVMGVIFFIIFTPIGILMRLFGRDELLLQFKTKPSYWIKRDESIKLNSFRRQF